MNSHDDSVIDALVFPMRNTTLHGFKTVSNVTDEEVDGFICQEMLWYIKM